MHLSSFTLSTRPSPAVPGHSNDPSPTDSAHSLPNMIGAPTFYDPDLEPQPPTQDYSEWASTYGQPQLALTTSSSYPHQHPTPTLRRTQPDTAISLSIRLLLRHPPMPHGFLTFLPLSIHLIHCPKPCDPKAGPRHTVQHIPSTQRPTTPILTSCPTSIRPPMTPP
jgi:hypothetical protein